MSIILFLDSDPRMTAQYLDDDVLTEQIKTTTNYLTYVVVNYNDLLNYKHDTQLKWINESESNYLYLLTYLNHLHKEFSFRFKGNHRMYFFIDRIKTFCIRNYFVYDGIKSFRYYGPEEYKQANVFDSYLEYYKKELMPDNPKHTNREFLD